MSFKLIRKSSEDNLIAGTIAIYRDNESKNELINELDYLFEFCYDLLLSKKRNVSNSPGFESIIGQHGTKQIFVDFILFLCKHLIYFKFVLFICGMTSYVEI